MTAAFATLVFLIAAWAVSYGMLVVLDDSGAKIIAALRGHSLRAREPVMIRPVTVRIAGRPSARTQTVRAMAEWRAAA